MKAYTCVFIKTRKDTRGKKKYRCIVMEGQENQVDKWGEKTKYIRA